MKKLNNKEIAAPLSSISDVLDSRSFLQDCLTGLEARLDGCDIKYVKTDVENSFVRYVAKDTPELYLSTQDFKGLIELEKYLITKHWSGSGKHLSITIWPLNKSSLNIEISLHLE